MLAVAPVGRGQFTPATAEELLTARLRDSNWTPYAFSGPSQASTVAQLGSFDRQRLERLSSGHYKVWIRNDFSATLVWEEYYTGKHEFDWTVDLQEVNCRTLETLTLRRLLYRNSGTGNATATWDWTLREKQERRWETMVPGSSGEADVKLLCQSLRKLSAKRPAHDEE